MLPFQYFKIAAGLALLASFALRADITTQSIVNISGAGTQTFDSNVQSGNPASSTETGTLTNGAFSWTGQASATGQLLPGGTQFGGKVSVSGTSPVGPFFNGGANANDFINYSDVLTPTGLSGTAILEIPLLLTGTVTISRSGSPISQTSTGVFFEQNFCDPIIGDAFCGLRFPDQFNTNDLVWNSSTSVSELGFLDIPISATGATPYIFGFWLGAIVNSVGGDFGTLTASVEGDFSHTGIFGPATLLDAETLQPLTGVTLVSQSGFDYLNGPAPVATPEPRGFVFGLIGLLVTALAARQFRTSLLH